MKKQIIIYLLCLCLLVSCGGKGTSGNDGMSASGADNSATLTQESAVPTEEDSRPETPWDSAFVDDRTNGNQTADDLFGETK